MLSPAGQTHAYAPLVSIADGNPDWDLQAEYARWLTGLPAPLRAVMSAGFADADSQADSVATSDGTTEVHAAQVLAAVRTQARLVAVPAGTSMRPDVGPAGQPVAAWRAVAFRQARAFLLLWDAGLPHEAQPNARSVIEHAALLQAVGRSADAGTDEDLLAAVLGASDKRTGQHLATLLVMNDRAGGPHAVLLDLARSHFQGLPPARRPDQAGQADGLPDPGRITALLRADPDGPMLESIWKQLSEGSHAGMGSIWPYLRRALRPGAQGIGPEPLRWAETLVALSWSLWAADDALDRYVVAGDLAGRHVPPMAAAGLVPG